MGMKLAKILYHLERAHVARGNIPTGPPGGKGPDPRALAERHESKAAQYLADGLLEHSQLAQTPGARRARLWRRRHAVPGRRGRWGVPWGKPAKSQDKSNELP